MLPVLSPQSTPPPAACEPCSPFPELSVRASPQIRQARRNGMRVRGLCRRRCRLLDNVSAESFRIGIIPSFLQGSPLGTESNIADQSTTLFSSFPDSLVSGRFSMLSGIARL